MDDNHNDAFARLEMKIDRLPKGCTIGQFAGMWACAILVVFLVLAFAL